MKKTFLLLGMLFSLLIANAQNNSVFTFDELFLPDTGFWNGSDTSIYTNSFGDDVLTFGNNYNPDYLSWEGFSFSNWTDTVTEGYNNQWSTFAGQAASDSIFGIAYIPINWMNGTYNTIPVNVNFSNNVLINSIKITNSTYAARIIRDGGDFNTPYSENDYFFVRIIGYFNGQKTDSVDFYLADYRNGQNLVVKDWQNVDLSSLDSVTSLSFNVFSSDTGDYGINTPTYFCLDDIDYTPTITKTQDIVNQQINIFPNPTTNFITFSENITEAHFFDLNGKLVLSTTTQSTVDVSDFKAGTYIIKAKINKQYVSTKFIKF